MKILLVQTPSYFFSGGGASKANRLLLEGLAREIVNKINTMRRDQGLDVVDRVIVVVESTERVKECYERYKEYIDHEVLAKSVEFKKCEADKGETWDLNGEMAKIEIKRV